MNQPFITLVDRILAITKDNDYLQNPAKQAQVKALEQESADRADRCELVNKNRLKKLYFYLKLRVPFPSL